MSHRIESPNAVQKAFKRSKERESLIRRYNTLCECGHKSVVGPVGTVILRNRQQRGSEPTTRCDLGFGLFILNSDRAGTHARSDTKETE